MRQVFDTKKISIFGIVIANTIQVTEFAIFRAFL